MVFKFRPWGLLLHASESLREGGTHATRPPPLEPGAPRRSRSPAAGCPSKPSSAFNDSVGQNRRGNPGSLGGKKSTAAWRRKHSGRRARVAGVSGGGSMNPPSGWALERRRLQCNHYPRSAVARKARTSSSAAARCLHHGSGSSLSSTVTPACVLTSPDLLASLFQTPGPTSGITTGRSPPTTGAAPPTSLRAQTCRQVRTNPHPAPGVS